MFFICGVVVAIALLGISRMIYILTWNARVMSYRQAAAASMKHAEENNCMYITVGDGEPVQIRFDEVKTIHHYLVNRPEFALARTTRAGVGFATIDCGDGSTLEVQEAGERLMLLRYQSPGGKTYRYALRYLTADDGWDAFLRIVSGEYQPG